MTHLSSYAAGLTRLVVIITVKFSVDAAGRNQAFLKLFRTASGD